MEDNRYLIPPMELKTIEIDIENGIFKVNGKSFAESCTGFSISGDAVEGYRVVMEMDTTVKFASYDMRGCKKSGHTN